MTAINPELFKGNAATIVLTVLSRKEMYGYELMKEIELRTEGALELKEGTLYPLLHQLEKDKAVVAHWEQTDKERKRKFYHITAEGRKLLAKKKKEWASFRALIESFIGYTVEQE